MVAGAANNQLAAPEHGEQLAELGILYAPDYIINAGGIINVADELRGYDRERAMRKVEGIYRTLRDLETRLGRPIRHFAYPAGDFDTSTVRAVAGAGYDLAYTVCRHQDVEHPRLTLPRTLLWERSSVDAWGRFSSPVLGCQVNGVFDLVAPCRRSHR